MLVVHILRYINIKFKVIVYYNGILSKSCVYMHTIVYIFFCLHVLFSNISLNCLNPATFYWSACTKLEKWAVVHLCVEDIDLAVFDWILNCPKDYKIDMCCFSAKLTVLWRKSKDWLDRHYDNMFMWSDTSTRGLLF